MNLNYEETLHDVIRAHPLGFCRKKARPAPFASLSHNAKDRASIHCKRVEFKTLFYTIFERRCSTI